MTKEEFIKKYLLDIESEPSPFAQKCIADLTALIESEVARKKGLLFTAPFTVECYSEAMMPHYQIKDSNRKIVLDGITDVKLMEWLCDRLNHEC